MKSCKLSCLLLLACLLAALRGSADALCTLNRPTSAQCSDLEDARYIDTYQLHSLGAPSSSRLLEPGNFRNLTSLRHLDLSGGKLESVSSGSFAKLGSLQTLDLAGNRIGHIEVDAFDGLKQLHSLKLGENEIDQLPVALLALKELRLLDLSGNPLRCDCPSLKLRDVLLARGVKLSRKTLCAEPFSARDVPMTKLKTETVCAFESQDQEMQADEPIEGSGEPAKDNEEEEDEDRKEAEEDLSKEDETEIEQSSDNDENAPAATTAMPEPTSSSSSSTAAAEVEAAPEQEEMEVTTTSTSTSTSTTTEASPATDAPPKEPESTDFDESVDSDEVEDLNEFENKKEDEEKEVPTTESPVQTTPSSTTTTESEKVNVILPDEGSGSGEVEDDGSGSDNSGLISHMPGIDFNETSEASGEAEEEDDGNLNNSTTARTTTTEALSLWGFGNMFNNFVFGAPTTEPAASSPEPAAKSAEEGLKEEQFIAVTESHPRVDESSTLQPKVVPQQDEAARIDDEMGTDMALDSRESKQGVGSYFVLAALLVILAVLIITAACKGDFCRRKQKRRDVERGTEMKDMQKSLLEQNSATQPKIQVSNGTTMENVPLMNSSAPPEEPKDKQRSYDVAPAMTNGSTRTNNGPTTDANDPIKPPRKTLNPEIEAPLNGLNLEYIDGPDNLDGVSDGDENEDKPPLSPGAQRVKITMQNMPDSVPKTPILITRLKDGENLVKTP